MSRFAAVFVVLASVSMISVTARAAEGQAAQADDVNTLNGQLVPVGESHRYRHGYKPWNVSTNPLGLMWGSYGLSVSRALGPNVALRADANYYAPLDSDISGFELGLGVPLYFRHMYSGFFLEPGMIVRQFESDEMGVEGDDTRELGPQMLIGWHWNWDSGLNFAIAAGIGRQISSDDDRDETFGNGYLRVGYAF